MNTQNKPLPADPVLLKLFKEHIARTLYQQLLEDIKPKLRAAASEAVLDLKGQIASHYMPHSDQLVMKLSINDENVKLGG